MSAEAPSASEITELLAHWWHRYDEARVDELSDLLTDGGLKLSAFELILDTQDSVPLKERA